MSSNSKVRFDIGDCGPSQRDKSIRRLMWRDITAAVFRRRARVLGFLDHLLVHHLDVQTDAIPVTGRAGAPMSCASRSLDLPSVELAAGRGPRQPDANGKPVGRFRWLRGPALTENDPRHLRGRRHLITMPASSHPSRGPSNVTERTWESSGNMGIGLGASIVSPDGGASSGLARWLQVPHNSEPKAGPRRAVGEFRSVFPLDRGRRER